MELGYRRLKKVLKTAAASACFAACSFFLCAVLTGPACATEKDLLDVHIPEHPAVIIPGPEVAPRIAAMSGLWEGRWSDGRASALVVLRMEKGSARILHAVGESADALPWHQWARATVVPGARPRLEWKTGWAAFSFELSDNGVELSGVLVRSLQEGGKEKKTVIMTRRHTERVSADRTPSPFVCPVFGSELRLIEKEKDPSQRRSLVDALVARAKTSGTPLVEPGRKPGHTCAAFIHRGTGREVALAGAMNGFSEQKDIMSQVGGTDLFYYCGEYPSDSRIEYRIAVDGTSALDPLNPRIWTFGQGSNSEAALPGYVSPKEIEVDASGPKGSVEELFIDSRRPGMARTATVYLPAGYPGAGQYPVLYLNDAFGALKFGRITTILDNLVRRRVIPPLIAVLLPSGKDRIGEYGMNETFEAFVVQEVVPAVDRRYKTKPSPGFRAVGGISAGATAALSLALRHPDVFGKCMAQSTATKLVPLINLARTGPSRPITVYLDVGRFEADFYGTDLVDASLRIRDALTGRGCPVHYREVNDGHGWANWRARTREALTFLFPAP